MIGIVVATHSNLAQGLISAAEMILGALARVEAISICQGDGPDCIREQFAAAIDRLDDAGAGVLILTDMFGGTPSNIGLSFMETARVEVLAGVNLPMLLKACSSREGVSLEQLAGEVKDYALASILSVSQLLKDKGLSH